MNQRQLEKSLLGHFHERFESFSRRFKRLNADMAKELNGLCETFGQEAVNAQFSAEFGGTMPVIPKLAKRANGKNGHPKSKSATLGYAELRPIVIEAVKTMKGNFTAKDVENILAQKKIPFRRNYVSLLIRRDVSGINFVGTQPRNANTQARNLFQVVGEVTCRPMRKKRARS